MGFYMSHFFLYKLYFPVVEIIQDGGVWGFIFQMPSRWQVSYLHFCFLPVFVSHTYENIHDEYNFFP